MSRAKTKRQRQEAMRQERIRVNRSIRMQRQSLDTTGQLGKSFDGNRSYYTVLGYPKTIELSQYRAKYDRQGLAGRIVDFPAEETWRDEPELLDGGDKDGSTKTPFVTEFQSLAKRLRLYHYCQRVDKLTGIGQFGVLLLGVTGGAELTQPVERLRSVDDLIYLRPYSQESVEIESIVTDPRDSRYGLPLIYKITPSMDDTVQLQPFRVHWSRVIHVAENLLDNEVYGRPRLMRVYNDLDDIMKVVGGSAEATWKLMRKGFVLNIDSDATMGPEDEAALQDQVDELDHGLRRFLQTRGMNVQDLGSEVVDPSGIVGLIIDMIAATTGIPQRILLGSERGELASSQDAANWAGRIADRRTNWAEPTILKAIIDRLVQWGALSAPSSSEYTFRWKPLFELSEAEKADLASTWAHCNQSFGQQVITASEWRGQFTPFSEELPPELQEIADQQAQQREQAQQAQQAQQGQEDPRQAQLAEVAANSSAVDKMAFLFAAARAMAA
jgi:hypothetical protein